MSDNSPTSGASARQATIHRATKETDISLSLTIDGSGESTIDTGVPFFDHMLTLLARHALIDLEVNVKGDIEVDYHHTVEDTGIVLGQAYAQALGDKAGLRRYGHAYLPMDETLVRVALDFSGRPLLVFRTPADLPVITMAAGDFPAQLTEEFFRGFAQHAALTLHAEVLYTRETHHMIEALFKCLAKALDLACQRDPRVRGVPSTKGSL